MNSLLLLGLCISSRHNSHWWKLSIFRIYNVKSTGIWKLPRGSEVQPNTSIQGHIIRSCPQRLQPPIKKLSSCNFFSHFSKPSSDNVFFLKHTNTLGDIVWHEAGHSSWCIPDGANLRSSYAIAIGSESLESILPYPTQAPAASWLVFFHYNFRDRPKRHASLLDSDLNGSCQQGDCISEVQRWWS